MSAGARLTALTGLATLRVECPEGGPCPGQPAEERRRRPALAKLAVECLDPIENLCQADLIRTAHGAASIGGESVSRQVDDVDVGGAGRYPVLEHAGTLVDHRVKSTLANLLVCNRPPHDAG